MLRPILLLAAVAATSATLVTPAHASGSTIAVGGTAGYKGVGDGVVAFGACTARVTPAAGEIAVATSVHCTVNGFDSPTVTLPGPVAASAVANATDLPVTFCVDAVAIISPTIGAPYTISSGTVCNELPS